MNTRPPDSRRGGEGQGSQHGPHSHTTLTNPTRPITSILPDGRETGIRASNRRPRISVTIERAGYVAVHCPVGEESRVRRIVRDALRRDSYPALEALALLLGVTL